MLNFKTIIIQGGREGGSFSILKKAPAKQTLVFFLTKTSRKKTEQKIWNFEGKGAL